MGWAELGQPQFAPQPYQRGLRDVPAARHGGQEMRLVDDDDVGVPIQHRDLERYRHLVGQVAVQVDARSGRPHGGVVDHRAVGVDDLPGQHLVAGLRTEPGGQLGQHRPAVQPHPRGSQSVAHRKWRGSGKPTQFSGTGSRISARASGALARSSSADTSSGWACDRISASTRAL